MYGKIENEKFVQYVPEIGPDGLPVVRNRQEILALGYRELVNATENATPSIDPETRRPIPLVRKFFAINEEYVGSRMVVRNP